MFSSVMKFFIISLSFGMQIDASPVNSSIVIINIDESLKTSPFYSSNQVLPIIQPEFLPSSVDEIAEQSLENGDHFEGDMVLTPEQTEYLNDTVSSRTGRLSEFYRWPKDSNGHVKVPYTVSETDDFCKLLNR
jgi:hypothetical protein